MGGLQAPQSRYPWTGSAARQAVFRQRADLPARTPAPERHGLGLRRDQNPSLIPAVALRPPAGIVTSFPSIFILAEPEE